MKESTSLTTECQLCGGTGWITVYKDATRPIPIGVRDCECRKQRIANVHLQQLDEKYHAANLEKMVPISLQQKKAQESILKNPAGNFFLFGGYRLGKSYLLAAQYNYLSQRRTTTFFRTSAQLVEELYQHYDLEFPTVSPILAALKLEKTRRVHVFIDDIEKVSYERTDFRKEVMFKLIDAIDRKDAGLSLTANMSLGEIAQNELLAPSVIARINDLCFNLEF